MTGLSMTRRGAAVVMTFAPAEITVEALRQVSAALSDLGRDPMIYAVVIKFSEPGVPAQAESRYAERHSDLTDLKTLYELCWQIECFSKPIVSLIDGPISGAALALTLYGTHRVAGPRFAISTIDPAGAPVPDRGLSFALARVPNGAGRYLALTGRSIGRADAYALGLVTHCIASEHFEHIEALIAEAEPIDPILDDRHADIIPETLLDEKERIERYFAADEVLDQTWDRLRKAASHDKPWADSVLVDIAARPKWALAVTAEALRRAGALEIDGVLQQDYRLAHRSAERGRGPETPAWDPATLDDVFAPLGADELQLQPRSHMQAGRG